MLVIETIVRNIMMGLAVVVDYVLWLYLWIVVARAVISWVNPDPWNPIVRFLAAATEPVLAPIRRQVFRLGWSGGIDFSPMILILIIIFLQTALVESLYQLAAVVSGS